MPNPRFLRFVAALALGTLFLFTGADWLQFRGTNNDGVTNDNATPTKLSAESVAWKAPLPGRGVSGPIVVGGKVIVTADSGHRSDRLHVLAFDAASGKPAWERQFWATGRCFCHPVSAVAAPTPASDGKQIYAFFSSNDLACLDLEGDLIWYRGLTHDFPTAANDVGMSSSPVVTGETVIVQVECQGDSFVAGINTRTGETRWKNARPRHSNWSSPCVLRGKTTADDLVIVQCSANLTALRPLTGEKVFSFDAACDSIASITPAGSTLLVPTGELLALDFSSLGSAPVLWKQVKLAARSPSPVAHDGKIYVVKRTVMACGDAKTGEVLWESRLKGNNFWATPAIANGHIYLVSENGIVQTVPTNSADGEVTSELELGENVLGSPAIADGAIYLRSLTHLVKLAER